MAVIVSGSPCFYFCFTKYLATRAALGPVKNSLLKIKHQWRLLRPGIHCSLKEIFPETVDGFFTPWDDWFRKNRISTHVPVPALNISDEKDCYKVTVAAPGLRKEDFSVDIENKVLTISAGAETEQEEEKKKYTRQEYSYSSFSRSFSLPENVNTENIEAVYENGILTLKLFKLANSERKSGKKIEIK